MVSPRFRLERLLKDINRCFHIPPVELEYTLIVKGVRIAVFCGSPRYLLFADRKICADGGGYVGLVGVASDQLFKGSFGSPKVLAVEQLQSIFEGANSRNRLR